MNYQLAIPTEFRAIRTIRIGLTRKYYASKIKFEVLVPFHLNLAKVWVWPWIRFERFFVLDYSRKNPNRRVEDMKFPGVSKK